MTGKQISACLDRDSLPRLHEGLRPRPGPLPSLPLDAALRAGQWTDLVYRRERQDEALAPTPQPPGNY